jgi:hypothetical protein
MTPDPLLASVHAQEIADPRVLAAAAGRSVPDVVAELNRRYLTFERVAGFGCWYWKLTAEARLELTGEKPKKRHRRKSHDGVRADRALPLSPPKVEELTMADRILAYLERRDVQRMGGESATAIAIRLSLPEAAVIQVLVSDVRFDAVAVGSDRWWWSREALSRRNAAAEA